MSKPLSALDKSASLLVALQAGDHNAAREFQCCYRKRLLAVATCFSCGIPEIADDIVQQALYLLCSPTRKPFDPARVSAAVYIKTAVRMAARDVRDSVTPPGQKKRQTSKFNFKNGRIVGHFLIIEAADSELLRSELPLASLDELWDTETKATLVETIRDDDAVPPGRDVLHQASAEFLLNEAFRTAPRGVFQVLAVIYRENKCLTDAAKQLGLQHTTIRRRIDRWVNKNPHLQEYAFLC